MNATPQPTKPPKTDRHDLIPPLHIPFDADNALSVQCPVGWGVGDESSATPADVFPTWLQSPAEPNPADPVSLFDILGLTPAPRGSLPRTERPAPAAVREEFVEMTPEMPVVDTQYIIITLAHIEYALPLSTIVEINPRPVLTSAAHVPVWVLGSTNWRGDAVPVLDLRMLFGYPAQQSREERLVVVEDAHGVKTGFVVDSISGLRRLTVGKAQQTIIGFDQQITPYIHQFAEYDNRSLAILDVDRLLADNPFARKPVG